MAPRLYLNVTFAELLSRIRAKFLSQNPQRHVRDCQHYGRRDGPDCRNRRRQQCEEVVDRGAYLGDVSAATGIPELLARDGQRRAVAKSLRSASQQWKLAPTAFMGSNAGAHARSGQLDLLSPGVAVAASSHDARVLNVPLRLRRRSPKRSQAALRGLDDEAEQRRRESLRQLGQRRRTVMSKLDRGYENLVSGRISDEFWARKSQEWEAELAMVDPERPRLPQQRARDRERRGNFG